VTVPTHTGTSWARIDASMTPILIGSECNASGWECNASNTTTTTHEQAIRLLFFHFLKDTCMRIWNHISRAHLRHCADTSTSYIIPCGCCAVCKCVGKLYWRKHCEFSVVAMTCFRVKLIVLRAPLADVLCTYGVKNSY